MRGNLSAPILGSALLALAIALGGTAAAQVPPSGVIDENVLFGGPDDIVRVIDVETAAAGTVDLVEKESFKPAFGVSGSARTGASLDFYAIPPSTGAEGAALSASATASLEADAVPSEIVHLNSKGQATMENGSLSEAGGSAYVDIRPSELSRFYLSGEYSWETGSDPVAKVSELFVDAAFDRFAFFRIGKQRVSWGMGYYYSPADVLSLAAIDPEDPTALREGPYAIKAYAPFGLNLATIYLTAPATGTDPASSSVAGKVDLVAGGFEISLGAFYRPDLAARPRAMLMFTGALGNVDVFGEAVAAWGSERTLARRNAAGRLETYSKTDQPVFQATAGMAWTYTLSGIFELSLRAQGYYNGSGYADTAILRGSGIAALKASGALSAGDLRQTGMFYAAGNLSVTGLFDGALGFGSGATAALSDPSLRVTPSMSFAPVEDVSVSLRGTIDFGAERMEFSGTPQATLGLSLPFFSYGELAASATVKFPRTGSNAGSVPATLALTLSTLSF
jgi:hypothetical protein